MGEEIHSRNRASLWRSGAKYPSLSCLGVQRNKKTTLITHTSTQLLEAERVSCVRGWEQQSWTGAGQAVPVWGKKKHRVGGKKRQSILNHNVHSSRMQCTAGYRVSGAQRDGSVASNGYAQGDGRKGTARRGELQLLW